ncbi:esterase/lipase family protein [Rhodococcus sp. MEB064]|uniref:esterase/lipase family protein n=1 Tax=Rhodococcus sp. MEB064 TaxID=1587522 RepID=UPI000698F010|nr:hypothetical protein [Rhodococcus sp. MEB064]
MSLCSRLIYAVLIAIGVQACVVAPSMAGPADPCVDTVLLVHDLGSSAAEWDGWADDLTSRGWCPVALTYGESALTEALRPVATVAGLAALEDSASQIRSAIDGILYRTGESRIRVVARGAGALAVQSALTRSMNDGLAPVSTLVTLGPLWRGTNLAGAGTIAAFNRGIGIYDELARLEKPVVGPWCGACGEIVTGSTFLTTPPVDVPVVGVRYVDVATATDGLVTDPLTSAMPGSEVIVVQSVDPTSTVDHAQLSGDEQVRRLALDALGRV